MREGPFDSLDEPVVPAGAKLEDDLVIRPVPRTVGGEERAHRPSTDTARGFRWTKKSNSSGSYLPLRSISSTR